MKNFTLLQAFCLCILFSLAVACNNNYASHCANGIMDGNETGIDCGGDCPNCPTNGVVNPNIFGNWYKIFNIIEVNNNITIGVNTNPACRANILNQVVSNVNGIVTYKTEGMIGACVYPTSSAFSYDNVIHYIHKLTPDTFVYANNCFLKGSNPYVGESPYVKVRFVILENECGDSSLMYYGNNGPVFYSNGQQYIEFVNQNNTNQGNFAKAIIRNLNGVDPNNPYMSSGYYLSWYYNVTPGRDYYITYKVQFWDKNDNLMYETIPYRKVFLGPNYNSNPFNDIFINVQWGM